VHIWRSDDNGLSVPIDRSGPAKGADGRIGPAGGALCRGRSSVKCEVPSVGVDTAKGWHRVRGATPSTCFVRPVSTGVAAACNLVQCRPSWSPVGVVTSFSSGAGARCHVAVATPWQRPSSTAAAAAAAVARMRSIAQLRPYPIPKVTASHLRNAWRPSPRPKGPIDLISFRDRIFCGFPDLSRILSLVTALAHHRSAPRGGWLARSVTRARPRGNGRVMGSPGRWASMSARFGVRPVRPVRRAWL
jgi:hypothetical protein